MMMQLQAFAKVNLTLDLTGRRADGYHLLRTVMQEISLCDDVSVQIKPSDQPQIYLKMNHADIPQDKTNTCYKAAEAFFKTFDITDYSVKIVVDKKIPSGAGLGGGSSDAAAVLRALNVLTQKHASEETLEKIGLDVGADVPFFIRGGTQLAQGIGEQLTPLPLSKIPYFVVIKPHESALTRQIYSEFDRMVASGKITQADYTTQKFVQAVSSGEDPYPYIGNMLQPATEYACYMVKVVCDRLRELGARACMTGSGTAVFGLFDGYVQALEVFRQFDLDVQAKYICVAQNRPQKQSGEKL